MRLWRRGDVQLSELDKASSRILVVDDEPTNVTVLVRTLSWAGYSNVESVSDGVEALSVIAESPPDLVILDLHMPGMDGYEVLEAIRSDPEEGAYLPVIAYTADVTREAREQALALGATDFLTKPGERTEIKLRVGNLLLLRSMQKALYRKNASLDAQVKERTLQLEEAQAEIVQRLAMAGEFRDEDTGEHTLRVGETASRIALALGLPEDRADLIALAARLHDIGKIGVSDLVLLKPGKLTEEEFDAMKQHTRIGAKILSQGCTPLLRMAERIALTHHERFDGTGYPEGLAGEQIPIEGRIVAVADVFDALMHARPYKEAWSEQEALQELRDGSGKQFDPKVVEAFLRARSVARSLAA